MATRLRQPSPCPVSRQAFPHGVPLTISDPDVQNGYEEALLPYFMNAVSVPIWNCLMRSKACSRRLRKKVT
jgi:hypothetical protein